MQETVTKIVMEMLLDLTAIFGENNEPNVNFIDQYIPYFETNAYLLYNTQDAQTSKTFSYRDSSIKEIK